MEYRDYQMARDEAWRMLIKYQVCQLPVKISVICKGEGLKLLAFSRNREAIKALGLEEHCKKNDGFLYQNAVFYNDACTVQRQRFTVAHELGHHLLGHRGALLCREPSPRDSPVEMAANVLASRILAPAFVLMELGVSDAPEEIARLCDISLESATWRSQRLGLLNARGKYYTSPLERMVREQFDAYIRLHKG